MKLTPEERELKKKAYIKEWQRKNRAKINARQQELRKANPERIKAYSKKYRPKKRKQLRKWREANPDKVKAASKRSANSPKTKLRNQKNIMKIRETKAEWKKRNPEAVRESKKRCYARTRKIVMDHYGAFCACCGENGYRFLNVDHKNHGKGNPAPRQNEFMRWIINNDFPDDLQILCFNCNMTKGIYGVCPHKDVPITE